jgi:hypothetical protein
LLVLYQLPDNDEIQRVVPGNMVVLAEQRPVVDRSWNIPLQPVRPFLMFEYVSPSHLRKDYEDNLIRYEQHLQTPYYLLFQPEAQQLILYHLVGSRYVSVKPNSQGRYPIPELEMEIGIVDGWVRYWFRGELLELPNVMRRELRESREATQRAQEQANNATRRAEQFEAQAEKAREEAEVARREADQERAARLALLQELETLRRQLGQTPPANGE